MENEIFFVHVKDSVEIRRSILESSRQTVKLLQRFELIRQVRVQKAQMTVQLRKNFKELTVLVNKLKTEMPKVNTRVKPKQESKAKCKEVKLSNQGKGTLRQLEEELKGIENKLNRMG